MPHTAVSMLTVIDALPSVSVCQHREGWCCIGDGDGCHLPISLVAINCHMCREVLGTNQLLDTCEQHNTTANLAFAASVEQGSRCSPKPLAPTTLVWGHALGA